MSEQKLPKAKVHTDSSGRRHVDIEETIRHRLHSERSPERHGYQPHDINPTWCAAFSFEENGYCGQPRDAEVHQVAQLGQQTAEETIAKADAQPDATFHAPVEADAVAETPLTWDLVLSIARGCVDYGGGYRSDDEKLAIFHHGIQTVVNALESASRD